MSSDTLSVDLSDGRSISVPLAWFPRLSHASAAERDYSDVHADVTRLEDLGLIERTDDGEVSVPCESIEILVPLARAVA